MLVIASKTSATARMPARRGISLPAETVVAAAVGALVVVEDRLGHLVVPVERLEQVGAAPRVGADHAHLAVLQRGLLVQHLDRQGDLADVVEHRARSSVLVE